MASAGDDDKAEKGPWTKETRQKFETYVPWTALCLCINPTANSILPQANPGASGSTRVKKLPSEASGV